MREWKNAFHQSTLDQGKEFFERGKVIEFKEQNGVYTAAIIDRQRYSIRIVAKGEEEPYKMSCKCPLAKGGGKCKHMAALLYAIEANTAEPKENTQEAGQNMLKKQESPETKSVPEAEEQAEVQETKETTGTEEKKEESRARKRGRPRKEKKEENVRKEKADKVKKETTEEGKAGPGETKQIKAEVQEETQQDEEEFYILSEDGIQKKPPVENVVQQAAAAYEDYSYFDCRQIFDSCGFTKSYVRHAMEIKRGGLVTLKDVHTGYTYNEEEQVGEAEAVGKEGKYSFPMRILFSRTAILHAECHCKECERNYWRFYEQKYCAYTAAALKLVEEQLKKNPMGNATDRRGNSLLWSFRRRQVNQAVSDTMGQSVMLTPRLMVREGNLALTFKVGQGKQYVIKDLQEFYHNVRNSAMDTYGTTGTQISHHIDNFTDKGREWIAFIGSTVQEEKRFEEKLIEARTYSKRALGKKNEVELYGWKLDQFYETALQEKVAFENRAEKKRGEMTFSKGNPRITMTIRKNYMKSKIFQGIEVECNLPYLFFGAKTAYYMKDNTFFQMDEEYVKRIRPFTDYADGTSFTFQIGRREMADFYYILLPKLRDVIDIMEEDPEEIEKYLPPEVEFVFYLDAEKSTVTCRPMARYGTKEISILDDFADSSVPRQKAREEEVLYLLSQWLPYHETETNEIHCGEDEGLLYQFLEKGVGALLTLGEVQCTKRFSNLNVARQIKMTTGVSVSSGLLNLEVSAEDISQQELLDILNSYRLKKKYHRLKNGDFMGLEDDSLKMLDEMMRVMHLSPKEFMKGNMQVPLYRTLYLDKLLEENEDIYSERDEYFRNLVREFKTVNDSDFKLPASLKKMMRNYQKRGYRWLRTLESCQFGGILADDMGLGKTLQVIAVLLAAREEGKKGTSLVVAPASLVFNWGEEIRRFAPELEFCLVTGIQKERQQKIDRYKDYDVLVTSYDLLKRDVSYYEDKEFFYQVIDEAQYIKNHTTSAAKAVKVIKSRIRYALTGTPIENRLSELWSIFDYLMPGFLYGYDTFKKEFEMPIVKYEDGQAMERLQKMVTPFILRRLKNQVLKDLPDKLEKTQYIQFQKEQQTLYDAQVVHMRQTIASQDGEEFQKTKLKILAELTRLRQICCDPVLCFENYKGDSAKLTACVELVGRAIEGGHKILLFSQFTSMLEIIAEQFKENGISFYTITGSTPKEKRLKLVKEFNENDTKVFLISLKAGGVGLNLTGADVVIHYDPWWNFAVQNQATDRAHRIGQKNKVTVYKLIAKGSVEEKIEKLQETKKNLSEQIIQGDGSGLSAMSREDFLELLG